MLHACCRSGGSTLTIGFSHAKYSRLSDVAGHARELDWNLTPQGLSWEWKILRPRLWWDLKGSHWERLANRRPKVFERLSQIDVRAHAEFLKILSAYRAKIILSVWLGVPVTKDH